MACGAGQHARRLIMLFSSELTNSETNRDAFGIILNKFTFFERVVSLKPRFVERLMRSFSIEFVILGDVSMVKNANFWDNYEF